MPRVDWASVVSNRCTGCDAPLYDSPDDVRRVLVRTITNWDGPTPTTWFEQYCESCADRMRGTG